MNLDRSVVQWKEKLNYLGVLLCTDALFKIDISETRRKFFVSVNSILSKCQYTSEMVKLQLMESHCLPILLYAIESLSLSNDQMSELNSCWNSVYRKIFSYNKWESVRVLICMLGRLDLHHIVNLRRLSFVKRMSVNEGKNNIISNVMYYYIGRAECTSVTKCFNSQLHWSTNKIKAMMFVSYRTEVIV